MSREVGSQSKTEASRLCLDCRAIVHSDYCSREEHTVIRTGGRKWQRVLRAARRRRRRPVKKRSLTPKNLGPLMLLLGVLHAGLALLDDRPTGVVFAFLVGASIPLSFFALQEARPHVKRVARALWRRLVHSGLPTREDLPLLPLARAEQVTGKISGGELTDPISGHECVAWIAHLLGQGDGELTPILRLREAADLCVTAEDGTRWRLCGSDLLMDQTCQAKRVGRPVGEQLSRRFPFLGQLPFTHVAVETLCEGDIVRMHVESRATEDLEGPATYRTPADGTVWIERAHLEVVERAA